MPVTIEKLNKAVSEAKRFLKKADSAIKRIKSEDEYFYCSKETGAVRRSSMDLSRELTELRR